MNKYCCSRYLFLLLMVCTGLVACKPSSDRSIASQAIYVWVWQRNEDLSFLDTSETGLALWLATVSLEGQNLRLEARLNPVTYPGDAKIIAVIRIEAEPGFDQTSVQHLSETIVHLVKPLDVQEVQLDFDVLVSQRGYYRRLLDDLRVKLPDQRLSITALASWCFGDVWIEDLPLDAAVPMYYRMGQDSSQISHYLSSKSQNPARICADNAGYSLDEPEVPVVHAKRIFLFSAEPWNENSLQAALKPFR